MEKIYLDNAATTALDKEVMDAMLPNMTTHFLSPRGLAQRTRQNKYTIN